MNEKEKIEKELKEKFERKINWNNLSTTEQIEKALFYYEQYSKFLLEHIEELQNANQVLRIMFKASSMVNIKERQAKKELVEALNKDIIELSNIVEYISDDNIVEALEEIIINNKQLINKHKEKE
jgi:hypothetical protein